MDTTGLTPFIRFVVFGGGTGLLSSGAMLLLAGPVPFAVANALVTVMSTLLATELHSRFTFGGGERASWRVHMKSGLTLAVAYLLTTGAMLVLHAVRPDAGRWWEQAVYLAASGLAGQPAHPRRAVRSPESPTADRASRRAAASAPRAAARADGRRPARLPPEAPAPPRRTRRRYRRGCGPGRRRRHDCRAGAPDTTRHETVVAGTSRPPATASTSTSPSTIAPGARDETGFRWVPPEGWTRTAKSPSNIHYHSPDGEQEVAASYALAGGGDLLTQWRKFEAGSHDVPGYRNIRLERTTFRGRPAVVWEYVFTKDGAPWRARQLGFTSGGKSYQLNIWYAAPVRAAALRIYGDVTDSFETL